MRSTPSFSYRIPSRYNLCCYATISIFFSKKILRALFIFIPRMIVDCQFFFFILHRSEVLFTSSLQNTAVLPSNQTQLVLATKSPMYAILGICHFQPSVRYIFFKTLSISTCSTFFDPSKVKCIAFSALFLFLFSSHDPAKAIFFMISKSFLYYF